MKTLILVAVSSVLLTSTVLPALADQNAPVSNNVHKQVVETSSVKLPGLRFFHANKRLALIGKPETSTEKKPDTSDSALDYGTDMFPTW